MTAVQERIFDWVPRFDPRSKSFPIRSELKPRPLRSWTWGGAPHLDQGVEGACVGHGWAHEVAARPRPYPITSADAFAIYRRAQQIDEWEGESYEGTSVLAGAKAVTERGWLKEYRWAFSLDDALMVLAYKGPLVIGVNWYSDMGEADEKGYLHASGVMTGGHCVLVKAINIRHNRVTVHNSWGEAWGLRGDAYLSFTDLGRLLGLAGECCVPVLR